MESESQFEYGTNSSLECERYNCLLRASNLKHSDKTNKQDQTKVTSHILLLDIDVVLFVLQIIFCILLLPLVKLKCKVWYYNKCRCSNCIMITFRSATVVGRRGILCWDANQKEREKKKKKKNLASCQATLDDFIPHALRSIPHFSSTTFLKSSSPHFASILLLQVYIPHHTLKHLGLYRLNYINSTF